MKGKIDEAQNLKTNSEQLLIDAQEKLAKSEKEGSEILKKAKKISNDEIVKSLEKMERSLNNKETAAHNKIERAKNDAINQVKKEAIQVAIKTIERVITENLDRKEQEEINLSKLKKSIKKLENTN